MNKEDLMRDVVLMMTVSVDGYVRGPNGGTVPEPELLQQWKLDQIRRAGTHIMGRVTYGEMASHWPNSNDAYAKPMNEIPKVVFSKTLEEATWSESTIARGGITDEIADLKRQPGGEIIAWGGATFVQALSRARLIDEYVLVIQPVAFGGGLPMFRDLKHCSSTASILACSSPATWSTDTSPQRTESER
jgi:dihydrofolate reductase